MILNFEDAREKHAQWRFTLRSAIVDRRTLNVDGISKDDLCDLGRWLHGEARVRYAGMESYADCVLNHAAFHVEAGKVARLINAGRYDEASDMLGLGSEYSIASARIGEALNALERATEAVRSASR